MFFERSVEAELANQSTGTEQTIRSGGFKNHLSLVDYATIIYLSAVATLLLFFHSNVPQWPIFVLANFAFVGLLIFFIKLLEKKSSKVLQLIRDIYPFFIYTFMFKEVALIVNILFPFWLENHLINWDFMIFGAHPTVWVQQFYRPWLTEFMAFTYWSYYILFLIAGFTFYLRKDKAFYHSFVFALSLTLYTCYFSYLFLGARGPHETLAFLHIEREHVYIFDNMVKSIQDAAAISGAAFPSSHVAAMWIILIFAFRFKKLFGWIILPIILSLSFSVVYLQYHYAVDSIAGILLVAVTYPLARFIEKKVTKPDSGTYLETSLSNV